MMINAERSGTRSAARRLAARTSLRRLALVALAAGAVAFAADTAPAAEIDGAKLQSLVAGPQRTSKNLVRDRYRHPLELLRFLGVKDDSTVVEILPGGGGYWTEILAPYLRDRGRYIAAIGETDSASPEVQRDNATFHSKLGGDPGTFGKVEVAEFSPGRHDIVPPGTADFVLTFRNVHNWMKAGDVDEVFASFYRALKPGGVLGVEEHRGRIDQPQDPKAESGYVRQDYAIALAEKAGFRLEASSEINANPKDTKDYSVGVWALPPTFRLGDKDHDTYAAIGESDRFVLSFVKPAPKTP